jgi:hypothetical protein
MIYTILRNTSIIPVLQMPILSKGVPLSDQDQTAGYFTMARTPDLLFLITMTSQSTIMDWHTLEKNVFMMNFKGIYYALMILEKVTTENEMGFLVRESELKVV